MDLVQQLRRDEGVRSKPYLDTVGKTTIGVGRNLTDVGLSDDEINYLLSNDIKKVQAQLAGHWWYDTLDPIRQAALQNMAFNLGIGGLLHFPSMLDALGKKDWQRAHDEALDSLWAKQVGARAQRLADQLLSGAWQ
jgi:lysozyme